MAKADSRVDKRLEFALRHFKGVIDTFNADSAIWRAVQLADEIKEIGEHLKDFRREGVHQGFEFTSYYIVGLITCLEWHARSRLFDLLSYDAANFEADDIKQIAAASMLEQLLHKQLTVAQLVASSTLINDLAAYLSVFDRILKYFELKIDSARILKEGQDDPGEHFQQLKSLFERRHTLVHEITHTQVGHWNLRDIVSFEEAGQLAQSVIELMKNIEKSIWLNAKPDFPNLISPPGDYSSRDDRLIHLIFEVENRLLAAVCGPVVLDIDQPAFQKSILLSREYIENEMNVLRSAIYAGHRYYSISEPLINKMLEDRLRYVRELERQLVESGVIWEPSEQSAEEPPTDGAAPA